MGVKWSSTPEEHELQHAPSSLFATSKRILLLLGEKLDEQRVSDMFGQFTGPPWMVECAHSVPDAISRLKSGHFDAWVVDSHLAADSGVAVKDLAQSEDIDAMLILLVSNDHPFAPAASMIEWAQVLVWEELSPALLQEMLQAALEGRRERMEWEQLVRRDPVTELLNRVGISELLSRTLLEAEESRQRFAVWVVKVDSYLSIVHQYGLVLAAAFLREVGQKLIHASGMKDTVGRLEQNVFAVVLPSIHEVDDAHVMGKRLLEVVRSSSYDLPEALDPLEVQGGLSIFPDSLYSPEALLASARWALSFFPGVAMERGSADSSSSIPPSFLSLVMPSETPPSIDWGSLEIVFQPQVDLGSGQPFCLEALARWATEASGAEDVTDAIHALECNGMIFELDLWMLEHTLKVIKPYWDRIDRVAVNISPVTLLTPGFLDRLGNLLPSDTSCLELELTETALLSDIDRATKTLHVLRAMGVRVALDDFGRGYSSLLRLQELPLDTLKLDREFVQGVESSPRARAIIESLIALADRLELEVVVEGVETEAQARQLMALGVQKGQGFWYAKPMPRDELSGWMNHPETMRNLVASTGG